MTTMKMMKSHLKKIWKQLYQKEGEITSASDAEILKVSSLADGVNFIEIEDEETGHSSGVFDITITMEIRKLEQLKT